MILIGAGRIGTALRDRAALRGRPCTLVTRTDGWWALDAAAGEPILVCTRNDDLDGVVERVPPHRHGDLVFVQNGMLRPWLARRGLAGCTRGILFFAVGRKGEAPEPGGTSPFCGPHAAAVARWLGDLGLPARAMSERDFAAVELEKLIWNSAFGLLCERFGCDVGTVCSAHAADLRVLVAELNALGGPELGVGLELDPLLERLCAYSLAIADYRGAVKEWPWRNGWFVDVRERRGEPAGVHEALLRGIGHLSGDLR